MTGAILPTPGVLMPLLDMSRRIRAKQVSGRHDPAEKIGESPGRVNQNALINTRHRKNTYGLVLDKVTLSFKKHIFSQPVIRVTGH